MFNWLRKSMLLRNILSNAGVVLVVVFVISYVSYSYSSGVLTKTIEQTVQTELNSTKSKILSEQRVVESELTLMTNQLSIQIYDEVPESNVRKSFRDYKNYNEGKAEAVYILTPEGNVYIDSENKMLQDFSLAGDPSFEEVLTGKPSWTEVMTSTISDESIIIAMVPIFTDEGEVHGVLASSIFFSQFREIVEGVKVGSEGYAYLLNSDTTAVAHPNPDLLGANVRELNVPGLNEHLDDMVSGQSGVAKYTYQGITKTNFYDSVGRLSLSVNVSEDDYLKPLERMATIQIVIGVLFFIFGALLSAVLAYFTVRKINRIKKSMNMVAEGDLTAEVQFKKGEELDEVGQIGVGLNVMLASVKEIITHIKISSESLAAASEQLSASAEQNRIASEETANSMQEIAEGAERQTSVMMDTMELFNAVNVKMNASSEEAKSMAEKSEEVKETAHNGRKVISGTETVMDNMKQLAEDTVRAIKDLNDKSDRIGEINGMISQIAEQTNLLALNAAIEAARAGEQGKGFAVVADEIRKLSAQSQESAQGIQALIVEMQKNVKDASDLIQSENSKVDEGIVSVNNSRDAFTQISENIDGVVEHIEEVVKSVYDTIDSTEKVNDAMEEVVSIVHETAASSEAIAASSQEQMAVSQEISSSSTQLAQLAEDLLHAVIAFKTE